ncbi:hypothetical protein M569_02994, partial [Genlisea aurea]
KLHAYCVTSGRGSSRHYLSLLSSSYALCGRLAHARKVFDELPRPTLLAYNGMIRAHASTGSPRIALGFFGAMRSSGRCLPDDFTYAFVVRACRDLALVDSGMAVHALIVESGIALSSFLGNSLLAMYMNGGDVEGAEKVFADMKEEKTSVSWNTMISGYLRNQSSKQALMAFWEMTENGVEIDSATILSVLPACGSQKDLTAGKQVQKLVKQNQHLSRRTAVQNALIDMFVRCGRMDEAQSVFDGAVEKDVVTWTSMVNGYVLHSDAKSALETLRSMQSNGVNPNEVTLASLLSLCAHSSELRLGKTFHGWAIRHSVDHDVNVETSLIDLYAKCDSIESSFRLLFFSSSRACDGGNKKTVPWNALLSGCVSNDLIAEAIRLFKRMLSRGVEPDDATLKSVLPAYAVEADPHQAMNVHGYVIRSGFIRKPEIVTGLMDAYSKSGQLRDAHQLFDGLPRRDRDIVSWSVIIGGYGNHGQGEIALSLFDQMIRSGIEPNEVAFTSVLHGCGHSGMVDEGLKLFEFMRRNHEGCLRSDHYTCVVDLLGRANRLEEARGVVESMGRDEASSSPAVWGALLGGCAIHENVEIGELAAGKLFELEPRNTGNYVLLGNIYSAVGRFDDAVRVRVMMDSVGLVKAPANSLV